MDQAFSEDLLQRREATAFQSDDTELPSAVTYGDNLYRPYCPNPFDGIRNNGIDSENLTYWAGFCIDGNRSLFTGKKRTAYLTLHFFSTITL